MDTFIECVRSQQCLWNPNHHEYRDSYAKDVAWKYVVETAKHKFIRDVHTAKIEWKKLRDNHRDALKRAKLGKNKLLPAHITTWKYAKAMQFLEPHMKYRITEHIEMEFDTVPDREIDQNFSTSDVAERITASPMIKRRYSDEDRNTETPPYKRPSTSFVRNNEDALSSFFNCALQSTREMPLWMQTQVKKRIFAVLIQAEEQLSHNENYNTIAIQKTEMVDNIKTENIDEENTG